MYADELDVGKGPAPPRSFKFVLVPDDLNDPVVERLGDGTRAVTDFVDEIRPDLVKKSGEPTAALREAIESGALSAEQMSQIDLMQLSGSCDILACTVPTPTNEHTAVSMYHNPHSTTPNDRATALAHACGHTAAEIRGDAFVSRIIDNEAADVWKRIDISADEVETTAEWVKASRLKNGGGGHGG